MGLDAIHRFLPHVLDSFVSYPMARVYSLFDLHVR